MLNYLSAFFVFVSLAFCSSAISAPNLNTLLMTSEQLSKIRAALPAVADPNLGYVLQSSETLWYNETVMKRSYQDSVGASSNDKWPNLVAASESIIGGLHDRKNHRWQFPFAVTAGTDDANNLAVENFVFFPSVDGKIQTMEITKVLLNDHRPEWRWRYPEGTVFGEVLFIKDGASILPCEVRTRTRYAAGWAANVYRPFPKATDLIRRIEQVKPNWLDFENLRKMFAHLEDNSNLQPAKLSAKAALAPTFQQDGYLDILPDFGDDDLVRKLLKETTFRSAYGQKWKEDGERKTYAASTKSRLSIVPNNYTAGLLEVSDDSCIRCHKETNRLVSEFYGALYLYGELWGMDGIFSFHPYDEKRYPELRFNMVDNRYLNAKLKAAGIFKTAWGE